MKIAILHGGKVRSKYSTRSANEIYKDYLCKSCHKDIHMYRIDSEGNIYDNNLKSDPYRIFPLVDQVIDTTYDHPKKSDYKILLHKLNIKTHMSSEIDNYEFRKVLCQLDVDCANHYVIRKDDEKVKDLIHDMWRKIHFPIKIKSNQKLVPSIVTCNPQEALDHVCDIIAKNDDVIIDDYSAKKIYVAFSIKNFRGEEVYVSPTVELIDNKDNRNRPIRYVKPLNMTDFQKSRVTQILKDVTYHLDANINKFEYTINKSGDIKIMHISQKSDYHEGKIMYHVFKDYSISFADIIK